VANLKSAMARAHQIETDGSASGVHFAQPGTEIHAEWLCSVDPSRVVVKGVWVQNPM